jgi:glycosyltransferase involved in cell wall biosynthesis
MLLSTSSVTGPAQLCLEDAQGLRQAGHEVIFGCDTRRPGNYVAVIEQAGFSVMKELTLCPKPTLGEIVRDIVRLRSRLQQADLVHCRFAHDHTIAWLAMLGLRPRPTLVRSAEIARSIRPGWFRGRGLRTGDGLIVSCQEYARQLNECHGIEPQRIHVLPGRVDAERFCPGEGESKRAEWGIDAQALIFGIVSRIKVDRLHEQIIRGFTLVAKELNQAHLVIIGRGEYESPLRTLVKQWALEKRIHFVGYQTGNNLVASYRALDAKIWLAEGNDGTCRAVLEAMACGKPVIVANRGAMAELVREEKDGMVVEPNAQQLAEAMLLLGRNQAIRLAMGVNARERAQVNFAPERRSQSLLRAYQEIAQCKHA